MNNCLEIARMSKEGEGVLCMKMLESVTQDPRDSTLSRMDSLMLSIPPRGIPRGLQKPNQSPGGWELRQVGCLWPQGLH